MVVQNAEKITPVSAPEVSKTVSKEVYKYKKQVRALLYILVISVLCNGATVFFCAYEWRKVGYSLFRRARKSYSTATVHPSINLEQALIAMKQKPAQELIRELSSAEHVYDGYTVRDLALATLCTYHHFNLHKALSGASLPQQERVLSIQGKEEVRLFPALSKRDFRAISYFAKTERYPFTAEGLFCLLKEQRGDIGQIQSLQDAFVLTEEFQAVQACLGPHLSKADVIELLLDGTFGDIRLWMTKSPQIPANEKRTSCLLTYLQRLSKKAARLLVQLEPDFAVHKLHDRDAVQLLSLLEESPSYGQEYALTLLESPRQSSVHHFAHGMLCKLSKKPELASLARAQVLAAYGRRAPHEGKSEAKILVAVQKSRPTQAATRAAAIRHAQYVVQNGDSLWRISRKFHVAIAAIKQENQLNSDSLRPGVVLKIPCSTAPS